MDQYIHAATPHVPWNKGKLVGQKAPLKLKDIWAIRVRLQIGFGRSVSTQARTEPTRCGVLRHR